MNVLGFDCASRGCSAAVLCDGRVVSRRSTPMERGQAEALLPMIAAVLAEAALPAMALDLIAVTIGPGAFTGLRIGLAAARGLGLATGVPLVGITSFAATAAAVPQDRRGGRSLVVALDSKREELFLQAVSASGSVLREAALVAPADAASWVPVGPLLLAGDGARQLAAALDRQRHPGPTALEPDTEIPDPADIARLGAVLYRERAAGTNKRPLPLRPLYLRAPDTTLPRPAKAAR